GEKVTEIVECGRGHQERLDREAGGLEEPADQEAALGQEQALPAPQRAVARIAISGDARVGGILDHFDLQSRLRGGYDHTTRTGRERARLDRALVFVGRRRRTRLLVS